MEFKNCLNCLLLLLFINSCCGFFVRNTKSSQLTGKSGVFDGQPTITITVPADNGKLFPKEFRLTFKDGFDQVVSYVFATNGGSIYRPATGENVWIIQEKDKIEKVEGMTVEMESYATSEGHSALLFNNSYIENMGVKTQTRYSCIIHVMDATYEYDIVPAINEYQVTAKSSQTATRLGQMVQKRQRKTADIGADFEIDEEFSEMIAKKKSAERRRRAVGGQPVSLYVECAMVVDYSAYLKQMSDAGITDQKIGLIYMKIFYSHLVNSINRRYINSLSTDPDLRLSIRLNSFLIHTTAAEATWADQANSGLPENKTAIYEGKQVIHASNALSNLRTFMNAKTLPFTYDHAFGMVDKDLWSSTATDPASSRSGVAGLAYVGPVCGTSRYSINEDTGFFSILILAHELGHNLGSYHDGDGSNTMAGRCSSADKYIMTPIIGGVPNNFYRFSNCSILQFKDNLLDAALALDPTFSCLSNVPVNGDLETAYFNTSLPGQLFSANDQCKMIYGSGYNADSCTQTNICATISCYSSPYCWSTSGVGAVDGTSCGTNQICYMGVCVSNSVTLATNFPASPCAVNPCLNGGVCVVASKFYICNCAAGYGGQNCEISGVTTTTTTTVSTTSRTSTATLAPGATTLAPGATTTTATTTAASVKKSMGASIKSLTSTIMLLLLISVFFYL